MNNYLMPDGLLFVIPPRHTPPVDLLFDDELYLSPTWGGMGVIGDNIASVVSVNGRAASRRILLINRDTLRPVADVWSDENGRYRFEHLDINRRFIVLGLDNEIGDTQTSEYAPDGWDFVQPTEK